MLETPLGSTWSVQIVHPLFSAHNGDSPTNWRKITFSPLSSKSRLAWSVLMIPTGNRGGTSCSTTVKSCILRTRPAPPQLRLASSCLRCRLWIPVSPSSTRPGGHVLPVICTTVSVAVHQQVPSRRQKSTGLLRGRKRRTSGGAKQERSPCRMPATAMNPFELSSDLHARRLNRSSLRSPRFPSGHSRAQGPSLRHRAHLVRSSAVGHSSASCMFPALCHQHHVWDRSNRGLSVPLTNQSGCRGVRFRIGVLCRYGQKPL